MSARVAVLTFPGSNSEEETVRACRDAGITTDLVHWTADLQTVRAYDAYVLPGGFAYEDRVRAGAVAAHDRLMEAVREGAERGKLVLGICNGAQILLEAGLAPGLAAAKDGVAQPQAGFTKNAQRAFLCRFVHVKLSVAPTRSAFTAALAPGATIPMWASHGEGRLAATPAQLAAIEQGEHVIFRYADAQGSLTTAPNGSALDAAALTNTKGNVLAIMPHAERSAWGYQRHVGPGRAALRGNTQAMLAPADGSVLFDAFATALRVQ
jgi:phosphoribosylformylglycinamidine synthase